MIKRYLLIIVGMIALYSCQNESEAPPFSDFSQPVHVATVAKREVPLYLEVMGQIDSPLTVEVRAQVSGKLLTMHVPQGCEVKAGDSLFTLDPAPFQAHVDQAKATLKKDEAALTFAKAKLERYKPLVKQDYVSQLHYDQYVNDVETLAAQTLIDQAALDLAKIDLGYCTLKAPMAGKISQCRVDPGNLVGPNDAIPLTELRQFDPIDVRFSLAQKDFQAIKAVQNAEKLRVSVLLPNETKAQHTGEVYFIDNHLDLSTGTLLYKAKLTNRDRALWPGEYVRVRLLTKVLPEALLVPNAAVQLGQEGSYLYVVQPDQSVEMRSVTVAARIDGMAIIAQNLKENETVVIDGQINLRPGSKVRVVTVDKQETP